MSRIGLQPISIPAEVEIGVKDQVVTVKGPKGTMTQAIDASIKITIEDNEVSVARGNDSKQARAFHGLYRSLINNMVLGVSKGFSKALVINGVGYRAEVQGEYLMMNLGYSSQIWYDVPADVTVTCESPTKVVVSGIDKQRVGQIASEIRGLRAPEPYKGKGIKYEDEVIRRKIGKSGVK